MYVHSFRINYNFFYSIDIDLFIYPFFSSESVAGTVLLLVYWKGEEVRRRIEEGREKKERRKEDEEEEEGGDRRRTHMIQPLQNPHLLLNLPNNTIQTP